MKRNSVVRYSYALKIFMIVLVVFMGYLLYLVFGRRIEIESYIFTESSRELRNPNRGFYHIYGFRITDEEIDYSELVRNRYQGDKDTCLTMVQVNLQTYRESEITEKGLANIDALFSALEGIDKQLIVRFLYDWDGENEQNEPENLEIILKHMQQLKEILHRYNHKIFTLQGLFIGNWGEMNGTKHFSNENIQLLAAKLAEVTDESTYLSIRTPAQWRAIVQLSDLDVEESAMNSRLVARLGLFNDGMLGSESDYGTYGTKSAEEAGVWGYWCREEELAFQEQLCRRVPNGGEVIVDNIYNDFDNAVRDLSTMHVTYINRDYDRNVFEKWEKSVVHEKGCFDGMDGLTYMERHLGYRLLITDAEVEHNFPDNYFSVDISMKNVGFAPLYKEHQIKLYLYSEEKDQLLAYDMEGDLRELVGGNESEKIQTLHMEIPIKDLLWTEYELYFSVEDMDTREMISFANDQEVGRYGYLVGKVLKSLGR